jgi:cysteinyl-tRNA synthetase
MMNTFVSDILGLKDEQAANNDLPNVLELIVALRNEAKVNHDYAASDKIRNELQKIGFQLHDGKEGANWSKI